MHEVVKIGIIGARPITVEGHNSTDSVRKVIMSKIDNIIQNLQSKYKVLCGITGLGLGIEQDFAKCCVYNNIDYVCYLPYPDQEMYWKFLPDALIEEYHKLLDSSLETFVLSDGHYSPRKIQIKNRKIIGESDYVIIIENSFNAEQCYKNISYAKNLQKKIIIVNDSVL